MAHVLSRSLTLQAAPRELTYSGMSTPTIAAHDKQ
jgi:hypothetical protein